MLFAVSAGNELQNTCRLPEEMRAKLSVQFQGEEGIDAGGVSREWFQVRIAAFCRLLKCCDCPPLHCKLSPLQDEAACEHPPAASYHLVGRASHLCWQVMAREMFNPNFSLFVPTPEGGTTFQPNPNSVVQNDEARGTNHLDFFKFVGRVVGKALYDGQFIDAYFTRSFYKHMLGQPLTYQVCAAPVARACC